MLSDGGVYDYSIYWDKDTNILFACQKTKGEESSQDMGANPIVQKWWDYMADIMEVNPDNSPVFNTIAGSLSYGLEPLDRIDIRGMFD